MSGRKNMRKRASQVDCKDSDDTSEKKIKTEQEPVEIVEETEKETVKTKQPIIAPNGKIFYPCQYCNKIFLKRTTSITHMKKCPIPQKAASIPCIENNTANKNESNINNNTVDLSEDSKNGTVNSASSKTGPKIKISQNITVKAAETETRLQKPVDPSSVYDYDEQDDDPEDKDLKENDEDAVNSRLCKHCKTFFDNPLDLLRHTRDCHNFPRTILPPDEIEKYFDSPNRSFCPVCEKPIKTRNFRSVFIKHLLVHTTGLTHECGICKKKFRRRDHMRSHEKRHIVSV